MKEWINEGLTARISQETTVVVFETNDNHRFNELMEFLKAMKTGNTIIDSDKVYVFVDGDKLYEVSNDGSLTPIRVEGVMGYNYITDINALVNFMDEELLTKRNSKKKFNTVFAIFSLKEKNELLEKKLRFYTTYFIRNVKSGDKVYTNLYENRGTVFIVTDNRNIFSSDTLRYFKVVRVPISTREERIEIIKKTLKELGIKKPRRDLVEMIATITGGMNLYETETSVMEAFIRGKGKIDIETIKKIKSEIIEKTNILKVETSDYGFEQIGGYDYLKDFIMNNVIKVIKNKEMAESLGLRIPRGILLFGPPGTGKTLFARAIAKEVNLPFVRMKVENLMTKWYGESEEKLLNAIDIIESMSPVIVFIDEIDRLGKRDGDVHEVTRRLFSILLEWLGDKDRKSIIIATTNRPQDLDEALVRVGRFDYIIPVLYPDYDARREILRVHTKVVRNVPLAEDVELDAVAEMSEYFTGAEIEEIVVRAIRYAFREDRNVVNMNDFMSALRSLHIDIDERIKQRDYYYDLAMKFTNDAEILNLIKH